MGKKKQPKQEAEVGVKFTSPSFRYKGNVYLSADVEKKASEGDEESLFIIANLVAKKSGVLKVVEEAPKEEGGSNE